MDAAPIRREADGLRGRHAHVARSVARLLAVAGFALAGWIALAALNDTAMADDGTSRSGAPRDLTGPAVQDGPGAGFGSGPAAHHEPGLATLRHFKLQRDWSPRETAEVVADDVDEVRERPVGYLRDRGRDVARDKDAAVRAVRQFGDAAGVPDVRVRDGGTTGGPSLTEIVRGVTDAAPLPRPAGHAPAAGAQDGAEHDEPGAPKKSAHTTKAVHVGDGKAVPAPFAGAVDADDLPEHGGCGGCRGGHAPADTPVLPGQDGNQRSGSAQGGHPFAPFADLATAVDPAAPLGMDLRAFRRTSLTDIAAPGRPAVVPD
ncbi:hypothetical protein [Actinomadura sediminis]|uniref:Uncharacterized protein n=1 Tax=Actinomadura sediminis TaxID=1038904 RepID=A0ABW3EZ08_9ACTN